MDSSELNLLHELFTAARDLEPEARDELLQRRCPDEAVRREVEEMIAEAQRGATLGLGTGGAGLRAGVSAAGMSSGESIGPYRLLERLGEGGFGEVWLAERREPMVQRVAIKVIKIGMDSRALVARFEQERQALAVMDHPNVARVFDAGTTARGLPYLVMEYVPGEPITRFCDARRLTIRQRLELFISVCEAVQHAHHKGIIHRDLKPSNILVRPGEDGAPTATVKVIDFGVAKAITAPLTDKTIFTETGQLVGTLEYMSPEQARGRAADVDTRSDVYSLGAVLYELLAGRVPLESATLRSAGYDEMQRMIREVDPPKPSTRISSLHGQESDAVAAARRAGRDDLTSELRRELDWIPLKALRKERAERYGSAADLARDIRNYLEGRALEAGPESAAYRLRKLVRRNRGLFGAGAAVGTALLLGAAGLVWQTGRMKLERDRALAAEAAERRRAAEVEKISGFHAAMLSGIDITDAGLRLRSDIREQFARALRAAKIDERSQEEQLAQFDAHWARLSTTDAARTFIDRTMLSGALEAAKKEFAGQPLVGAKLLQALGDRYSAIGLPARAEELQRAALQIYERELGEDDPLRIRAHSELGSALFQLDRFAEAEPHLRGALEKRRRVSGDDHPDTIVVMNLMAHLLGAQERYGQAEPLAREALERARRALGEDDPRTLVVMNNLASLLSMQKRFDQAEPLTRELLARRRRVLGDDHPQTLNAVNNMGVLLKDLGRLDEAEPYYREGLERCRRVMGEEHPDTLISIHNMGFLLHRMGRSAEAEPFWRECLEKRRRVLGPEHPRTIVSVGSLGVVLKAQDRYEEAEPFLREALELGVRTQGEQSAQAFSSRYHLGDWYAAQGRFAEALPWFTEGVAVADRHGLPEDHPLRIGVYGNIASVYALWDKADPGRGHAELAAEWRTRQERARQGSPPAGGR